MRSATKPAGSQALKARAAKPATASGGAAEPQLRNREAAAALVEQVSRELNRQNQLHQQQQQQQQTIMAVASPTSVSGSLVMPTKPARSARGSTAATIAVTATTAADSTTAAAGGGGGGGTNPPAISKNSTGRVPLHVVSGFLRYEAEQLVAPMRADRSSRDNYTRHVLLLDEFLHKGNGALGFTPVMVLSGLAEMLALFQQAFMDGEHLTPGSGNQTTTMAGNSSGARKAVDGGDGNGDGDDISTTAGPASPAPRIITVGNYNGGRGSAAAALGSLHSTSVTGGRDGGPPLPPPSSSSFSPHRPWAGMPVESFLPPLVRRVGDAVSCRDEEAEISASHGHLYEETAQSREQQQLLVVRTAAETAAWEKLYSDTLHFSHGGPGSMLRTAAAAAAAAVEEEEGGAGGNASDKVAAAALVGNTNSCGAMGSAGHATYARAVAQQQLFTVPDAVRSLLRHLAARPIVCLSAEDQRCLPEALAALCDVIANIVAFTDNTSRTVTTTTANRNSGGGKGAMTRRKYRALAHGIRLAALEAIQALLAPLGSTTTTTMMMGSGSTHGMNANSNSGGVSLVNGRVVKPVATGKKGSSSKAPVKAATGNPLYSAACAPFALAVAGESSSRGSFEYSAHGQQIVPCLVVRWSQTLDGIEARGNNKSTATNSEDDDCDGDTTEDDDDGDEESDEEDRRMRSGGDDGDSGRLAPLRLRRATRELSVLLRVTTQLVHVLAAGHIDPLGIAAFRRSVPALLARTLAQSSAAVAAYSGTAASLNASLCIDLLWRLTDLNAAATAKALLYTTDSSSSSSAASSGRSSTTAASVGGAEEDVEGGRGGGAVTPAEDLFQALLSQLNASHRQHHRELRNDLVAILSRLLKSDTERAFFADDDEDNSGPGGANGKAAAHDVSSGSCSVMLPATVDAINAVALVLFDLVCGPESSATTGKGSSSTNDDPDGWLALTATLSSRMPPVTQVALKRHCTSAMNRRAVASPALRLDALQLKRLGWQCLQLFYGWQTAHLASMLFNSPDNNDINDNIIHGSALAFHNPLVLVDLCRMGFVDVLLMYCDVACDCPAVVAWTREELLTLQLDAWTILTAMMGTAALLAEVNAAAAGATTESNNHESNNDDNGDINSGGEDGGRLALSLADTQLVEAGGIGIVLDYLQHPSPNDSKKKKGMITNTAAGTTTTTPDTAVAAATEVVVVAVDPELEAHKKAAIVLLSALASNGLSTNAPTAAPSAAVRHALLNTPALVSYLVAVLDTVRTNGSSSTNSNTTNTTAKNNESESRRSAAVSGGLSYSRAAPLPLPAAFFLAETEMDVALAALNLLVGVGAAAVEVGGKIREVVGSLNDPRSLSPVTEGQEEGGGSGDGGKPRWNTSSRHRDAFTTEAEFLKAGGVEALLEWTACVLEPQRPAAALVGRNGSLVSRTRTATGNGGGAKDSGNNDDDGPVPPLLESFLVRHLSLLSSLLDAVSALVVGRTGSEATLVEAGGVHVLLELAEALAIASDPGNIFAPFMHSAVTIGNSGGDAAVCRPPLDATVIVRDALCAMKDADTKDRAAAAAHTTNTTTTTDKSINKSRSPQRAAFHAALSYTLNILSEVLMANREAREQFVQWRSRRIVRALTGVHMNGAQLLINLWMAALPADTSSGDDGLGEVYGEEGDSGLATAARAGLGLLRLSVRGAIGEDLRREYVRRLLREKYANALGRICGYNENFDASSIGGSTHRGSAVVDFMTRRRSSDTSNDGTGASPGAMSPFTEEELVRYAVYIVQGNDNNTTTTATQDRELVVASILDGDPALRQLTVRSMVALIFEVHEESGGLPPSNLSPAFLERAVGLGVRVHSCLAALGFEAMVRASDAGNIVNSGGDIQGSDTAVAVGGGDDGERMEAAYGLIALTPAERAQLIVIAALPALCVDELCLTMADVALAGGLGDSRSSSSSVNSSSSRNANNISPSDVNVLIRPTSPDRRSLVGLLGDIYNRGSELAQLTRLCEEVETAQVVQMLDRFLATRIRFGPIATKGGSATSTSTRSKANKKESRGGATAKHSQHYCVPQQSNTSLMGKPTASGRSVVVTLSPMAARVGGGGGSGSGNMHATTVTATTPPPPPAVLAASVRDRLAGQQQAAAEGALSLASTAVGFAHSSRHHQQEECAGERPTSDEEAEETAMVARRAGQLRQAQSRDHHHNHRNGNDTSQTFGGPSIPTVLADAAHTLAASSTAAAAALNGRQGSGGGTKTAAATYTAPSHSPGGGGGGSDLPSAFASTAAHVGSAAAAADATRGGPALSSSYDAHGRPMLSLAERRVKRLAMVQGSLRRLPSGTPAQSPPASAGTAASPSNGNSSTATVAAAAAVVTVLPQTGNYLTGTGNNGSGSDGPAAYTHAPTAAAVMGYEAHGISPDGFIGSSTEDGLFLRREFREPAGGVATDNHDDNLDEVYAAYAAAAAAERVVEIDLGRI